MCNHGFIGWLFPARSLGGALASALFVFALCAPLAAQMPGQGSFGGTFGGAPGGTFPPGAMWHADQFGAIFGHFENRHVDAPSVDEAGPSRTAALGEESVVSVDELRHPLTEKAQRLLAAALAYADRGEHGKAIAALREGMAKVPALVPYAHGVLGVEYLRLGQTAEAVPELTEAAILFPHDAMAHSNLAVSLCLTGQTDRAEQEARMALYLAPTLPAAQELLGDIAEAKARHDLH